MLAWPSRFPPERVREFEFELGQYAFARQYQQSPTPRKGGIFKREYWQPYVVPTTGSRKVEGECEHGAILALLEHMSAPSNLLVRTAAERPPRRAVFKHPQQR